jgi:nitrate reductase alpha subunit
VIEDGEQAHDVADVAFPYFGGVQHAQLHRQRAGRRRDGAPRAVSHLELAWPRRQGRVMVATVFDLQVAQLRHRPWPAR